MLADTFIRKKGTLQNVERALQRLATKGLVMDEKSKLQEASMP